MCLNASWSVISSTVNRYLLWASYRIRKITGCLWAGNAGNVSPPPWVSDPDMHHGTCVTHVQWCMPGSLTSGFLWSRWWGKLSRHSQRKGNPQFCVSVRGPLDGVPWASSYSKHGIGFSTFLLGAYGVINLGHSLLKWRLPDTAHFNEILYELIGILK